MLDVQPTNPSCPTWLSHGRCRQEHMKVALALLYARCHECSGNIDILILICTYCRLHTRLNSFYPVHLCLDAATHTCVRVLLRR